ncbi:MAG: hypothetical protein ABI697_10895 [Devosia sp.]
MAVYNGIGYRISRSETQWYWTIEDALTARLANRKLPLSYATHREAEKACRAEIDRTATATRA